MTSTLHQTTPRIAPLLIAACSAMVAAGCASHGGGPQGATATESERASDLTVLPYSEVQWGALNPARGDAGPRAADLWGDRTTTDATGFLVRFAEGFSSPPHIHNTTYRGIVIEGFVHNDDPSAEELWMPQGSYWTQPAGEVHITSAKGEGRVAYIEIQHGPYLVMPPEEASDNGERAVNVHAANMVWLDASTSRLIKIPSRIGPADGPRVSYLWGDPQDDRASGSLIELPPGHISTLTSADASLRIVVVKGNVQLHVPRGADRADLGPGSFVGSSGSDGSSITWSTSESSVLYVRSSAPVEIVARPAR